MTRQGLSRPGASDDDLARGLHAVAIHLLRHVRAADRSLPVGPARASALSVLVFAGPRALGDLARAEQVSTATMSRMVASLVQGGWVRRERDPADARRVRLAASPRAVRALHAGRERRLAVLAALLGPLDEPGRARLADSVATLERLLGAAAAPEGARAPRARGPLRRRR